MQKLADTIFDLVMFIDQIYRKSIYSYNIKHFFIGKSNLFAFYVDYNNTVWDHIECMMKQISQL